VSHSILKIPEAACVYPPLQVIAFLRMSFLQDNTSAPNGGASGGPTWEDMVNQMSLLSSQVSQQTAEIDRLNEQLSATTDTAHSAQAEYLPSQPSLVDCEEDSDVLYPEDIRSLFIKPFLVYKRLSATERKKLMDEAGVPECPGLTPCVLPPLWEEFIKNKTMPVKTFYDEHLLQAQYRHLDAIRFATFFVAEVMARLPSYDSMDSQEISEEDPDLHSLGIGLLTMLRDSQTAQALSGREELAKHTGTTKALAKMKGPAFFSEEDMGSIETANKQVAQMRSLLPKKGFSGPSSSKSQAGRGKKQRRYNSKGSYTAPPGAPSKQAEGSTPSAPAPTTARPSKK
jgi:hypothetical protein